MKTLVIIGLLLLSLSRTSYAQGTNNTAYLSALSADAGSPLYATYAAALERSAFTLDEGYHFLYDDSTRGVAFTTDSAGEWCIAFFSGGVIRSKPQDMDRQVLITRSYPDLVQYSFTPYKNVEVNATFIVLTSRTALHEIVLRNTGTRKVDVGVACFLRKPANSFTDVHIAGATKAITFAHSEPPDGWSVGHGVPYVDSIRNILCSSENPDCLVALSDADLSGLFADPLMSSVRDSAAVAGIRQTVSLTPGASKRLRFVRAVAPVSEDRLLLIANARRALSENLDTHVRRNEMLFRTIPRLAFPERDHEQLYWSAFTLLRQCMLPPEGRCHFNYYVFSREPQWGWGHGGQVFHESLAMLAYVLMDPASALNAQRVFMERQHPDGYINYRTGPYLDETIPYNHQLTTSAPWFNWENWELYKQTRNRTFLAEAYSAGVKFYNYWLKNRDKDGDGLCEWGAHAVLESVRDGKVAVWDEVGWPSSFDALDLNCMLVKEAQSLSHMAQELKMQYDAKRWNTEAEQRRAKINAYMWDGKTDFYYHVDRVTRSFTHKKQDDLKRQEIIGFLPLWAGVATHSQAAALVKVLTDTAKFWRRYGIPSLAADDPYYDPRGYWNGPVWVQWQYLIFRGLLDYGYAKEARDLAEKVFSAVITQLKTNHAFWELYSPDEPWAGWHRSYIWTGIVARMMVDLSYH